MCISHTKNSDTNTEDVVPIDLLPTDFNCYKYKIVTNVYIKLLMYEHTFHKNQTGENKKEPTISIINISCVELSTVLNCHACNKIST